MNIKLDKKSEALLKEMLRKNSRYGSVDLILNEAVARFYSSEKRESSDEVAFKACGIHVDLVRLGSCV